MAQPPNTTNGPTQTTDQIQTTTANGADRNNSGQFDVTMASLSRQIESINATLEAVRSQQGLPALPEVSRPGGGDRYRPHILKPNKFSNLQGENFLAWRAQFQAIAKYNKWSDAEAKTVALAHMVGLGLEAIIDINVNHPAETLNALLDRYQNRFLPKSESEVLRTQFNYVYQLPTESVQKLHSRMRVLYHLAYPDQEDRSEITLIERYIQALNNRVVQGHVRRRKPKSYADALDYAQEETSYVLLDNLTHAPGGPQQPQPSDSSFIGAIRGRPTFRGGAGRAAHSNTNQSGRHCFYCGDLGHMKERCPLRLRDMLRSRGLFKSQRGRGGRGAASATGSRPPLGNATKRWTTSDTKLAPTMAAEGYGATQLPRRIATIEEQPEEEEMPQVSDSADILDDLDFNTLDEATIAALYEEIRDIPIEAPRNDGSDFPAGQ